MKKHWIKPISLSIKLWRVIGPQAFVMIPLVVCVVEERCAVTLLTSAAFLKSIVSRRVDTSSLSMRST